MPTFTDHDMYDWALGGGRTDTSIVCLCGHRVRRCVSSLFVCCVSFRSLALPVPVSFSHLLSGRAAVGGDVVEVVGDAVRHALAVAERRVAGEALGRSRGAGVAVRQRRVRGGRCCHGTALDHGVLERDVRHCCYLEDERVMVILEVRARVGLEESRWSVCVCQVRPSIFSFGGSMVGTKYPGVATEV